MDLLRETGEEVRVLARRVPERRKGSRDPVKLVAGDVLDPASLERPSHGCDTVYHLAGRVIWGERAHELYPLHVDGTRNVLVAAEKAKAKRIVFVSTSGTVGLSANLSAVATEDSPYAIEIARRWPYYLSKIYAEKLALEQATKGLPVVVVSPALLPGPDEVTIRFVRREIGAVPPGVVSIVDVRDAAAAIRAAAERGTPGRRYLLGVNMSFAELFQALERVSGIAAPRLKIPEAARGVLDRAAAALSFVERAVGFSGEEAATLAMAGFSWAVSSDRARAELDFRPRPLEETLAYAVEHARSVQAEAAPAGLMSSALHRLHRLTGPLSRPGPALPREAGAHPDRSS